MSHATIPIFVPHLACPNQCVFCNQKKISGVKTPPEDISEFLKSAISDLKGRFSEVDIAFFGGSFTGIEEDRMRSYLSQAKRFFDSEKEITGIRLSTRPDYINEKILDVLKEYGVTAVEIGAQSFSDEVLEKSKRGHTAKDTENALKLLKKYGFETVLQLMPGMYGDTAETINKTLETALKLSPDGIRIYPCVVISETPLEKLYLEKKFTPLTVEEAVKICAKFVPKFEEKGIKIIKTGLHSSDLSQNGGVVAGPYHPAFGEMVKQRIYLEKALKIIEKTPVSGKTATILVAKNRLSQMTGQNKNNIKILFEKTNIRFSVKESDMLSDGEIKIVTEA